MKTKRRVSLNPSTWNRREKQPLQIDVEPETTPAANDYEQRHDQDEWLWMGSVGDALGFGGGQEYNPKEMEREAAPAPRERVEPKKKGGRIRPMFAALKQKLRRKPKPLLNLNEENHSKMSEAEAPGRGVEKNPSQPLLTYEQWERFMDTVAFPEKSKPYLAFKEYITSTTEKTMAILDDMIKENESVFESQCSVDDRMSLAEYLSTQSVDERSVAKMKDSGITWEEFMDTIAFPEKILARKYNDLLMFIAKNRIAAKDNEKSITLNDSMVSSPRGSLTKDDKYAFDDEDKDDVQLYSVVKDHPEEDLGISLTAFKDQEGVFISHVARGTKGAAAGLKPGMQVISINHESCSADLEGAQFMLENADHDVHIFAQPGSTPGFLVQGMQAIELGKAAFNNLYNHAVLPGFMLEKAESELGSYESESLEEPDWEEGKSKSVEAMREEWEDGEIQSKKKKVKKSSNTKTFTVNKESRSEVIGIAFVQTQDWPGIFVNQVMPSSKFYNTGLKKGMQIISINGQPCPDKIESLIKKIQKVTGKLELCVEISIDVASTMDHDSFVTATIVKSGGDDPGLTLKKDRFRGGVFINHIDPYSSFVNTDLRPGLRIMSINGHACPKNVRDCMYELQQVDGMLGIIAENVPEKSLHLD